VPDLRHTARRLGGEVVGNQVLCPGPGHSPRDRSLAVRFSREAPDGFVAHSFCGDDWRSCRDHIASLLGISHGSGIPTPARWSISTTCEDAEQKRRKAIHLWKCRSLVEDSPVETYLRKARGYLGPIPATIGYLKPGAYYWPAMIAAFGMLADVDDADEGEIEAGQLLNIFKKFGKAGALPLLSAKVLESIDHIRGIHLTFLDEDGSGKAAIDTPKRMLGPSSGAGRFRRGTAKVPFCRCASRCWN
jgi:hypothetical protein